MRLSFVEAAIGFLTTNGLVLLFTPGILLLVMQRANISSSSAALSYLSFQLLPSTEKLHSLKSLVHLQMQARLVHMSSIFTTSVTSAWRGERCM